MGFFFGRSLSPAERRSPTGRRPAGGGRASRSLSLSLPRPAPYRTPRASTTRDSQVMDDDNDDDDGLLFHTPLSSPRAASAPFAPRRVPHRVDLRDHIGRQAFDAVEFFGQAILRKCETASYPLCV